MHIIIGTTAKYSVTTVKVAKLQKIILTTMTAVANVAVRMDVEIHTVRMVSK